MLMFIRKEKLLREMLGHIQQSNELNAKISHFEPRATPNQSPWSERKGPAGQSNPKIDHHKKRITDRLEALSELVHGLQAGQKHNRSSAIHREESNQSILSTRADSKVG